MARVFREKKPQTAPKLLLFIAAVALLIALVWNVVSSLDTSQREEGLKVNRDAVIRATVQCYSLEGRYPPSLEYLEQHYGLTLDRTKYVYNYQTIGENIMPNINLFPQD
jgi:hypothetical protein